MEPMTLIGLGALGLLAYKAMGQKKDAQEQGAKEPAGEVGPQSFEPFSPSEQGAAWYAATGLQWMPATSLGDNAGHTASVYRGASLGDSMANRAKNDRDFRQAAASGLRLVVNTSVLTPVPGMAPYLLLVPDGFNRASVPSSWGDFRQLYAPPPGTVAPGPGPYPPGPVPSPGGDPFAEIPDAALRDQVRQVYESESVGLLELDATAKALDKEGYPASAEAIRQRRKTVALQRSLEAQQRGGWLYVVRRGDIPFVIAQWYGGVRPNSLKELREANPSIAANNWKPGWQVGVEILLPGKWPDPSLKPAPATPSGPGGPVKPSTPSGGPQGPTAQQPARPGYYIDPATGLPIGRPGDAPWMAPPGSLGAAAPGAGGGLPASLPAAMTPMVESVMSRFGGGQ